MHFSIGPKAPSCFGIANDPVGLIGHMKTFDQGERNKGCSTRRSLPEGEYQFICMLCANSLGLR